MARGNNLPFPLGSTYWEGDTTQISASAATTLEGKVYRVDDYTSESSGVEKLVRVVRNSSGGRLGNAAIAGQKGLRYGTTSGWWGRKIRGLATALTDYGVAMDDTLTTSVANNDLFYVIEKGPVKVLVGTSGGGSATGSVTFTAGKAVFWGRTSGLLNQMTNTTAERHPVGAIQESVTSGVTGNRQATVFIGGNFQSQN